MVMENLPASLFGERIPDCHLARCRWVKDRSVKFMPFSAALLRRIAPLVVGRQMQVRTIQGAESDAYSFSQ